MNTVKNNKEKMRFEIVMNDETAYLDYRFYHKSIAFMHTVVPAPLSGKGLATTLAIYAFQYAKEYHMPVMVYCPFVSKFLKKNPVYREQLDPKYYHRG